MNTISIRSAASLPHLGRDAPVAASRFRRRIGASGRAYLVSVYPIEACPDYVDAVVVAVDGRARRTVWLGDSADGGDDLAQALYQARMAGATEVHVHLLAESPAARGAVLRDLDDRQ